MSISIREVTTKKDLKEFVRFPFKLYGKNQFWIPPLISAEIATLDSKKNPAFDYCEAKYWLAGRDGKVVGRIAGIINHSFINKWNKNHARFGWLDFVNDAEVSKALLATVENWAAEKGMDAVCGPLGFTDLDYEGMLVEGFEETGTMATIYNYPYYPVFLDKAGYVPDISWIEFEVKTPDKVPEKLEQLANIVEKKLELKVIHAKKVKDILHYAKDLFKVLNDAYKDLYGVVALTERQVDYYIKMYFSFIRPDFVSIVVDKQDNVIGFAITMPSISGALQKANGSLLPFGFIHLLRAMKKNNQADLLLIGIRPDYQGKGVNALLMREITRIYIDNNIKTAESNPELETNEKVHALWKLYEKRQHKKRTCFIKHLQ